MNEYYGCEYIVREKSKKQKLGKLIKKLNKENSPPDDWSAADAIQETVPHVDVQEANKPEGGKVYALTGSRGSRCIANGNTWAESEVTDPAAADAGEAQWD